MGTQSTNTGLAKRRATLRRVVVGGLIAVCLLLFTAYFRESGGGVLHNLQSGASAVVAPVQSVAARAIEPFQDAWRWTTGLVDARQDVSRLEREVAQLQAQQIQAQADAEELDRLRALNGVGAGLAGYRRLTARVIGNSPVNWYSRARIDVGRDDGVITNSPVVTGVDGGNALVGTVLSTTAHTAVVAYITDPTTQVGATVQGRGSPPGLLQAAASGQLQLTLIPREFRVDTGDVVVTSGSGSVRLPGPYPPDIPVGRVVGAGRREVDVYKTVQVNPFAEVRTLRYVVVLVPESAEAKRRATG